MVGILRYRLGWYSDAGELDCGPLPGPMTVGVIAEGRSTRWVLERGPDQLDDTKVCLTLASPTGNSWSESASNFFDAMLGLRRSIEDDGVFLLVNGARRRVWPSPASRQSLGLTVFSLYQRVPMHRFTGMRLFGPAPRRSISPTVQDQIDHYTRWLLSMGLDPTARHLRP